ncbi:hypothetical protein ACOSP7_028704 [Xanthoceras sorbifolium]
MCCQSFYKFTMLPCQLEQHRFPKGLFHIYIVAYTINYIGNKTLHVNIKKTQINEPYKLVQEQQGVHFSSFTNGCNMRFKLKAHYNQAPTVYRPESRLNSNENFCVDQ